MNGKVVSVVMLTLLLIGMLTVAFNIQTVKAGKIVVPDDYPTIQEAINKANEGDTIFVRAGIYYEHDVVVNKSLALVGEDKSSTIIDGSRTSSVVIVSANFTVVSNFTIQNCAGWLEGGIKLFHSYFSNIMNNLIKNSTYGVLGLQVCGNNTIFGNILTNNYIGVGLSRTCDNSITNNTIIDNDEGIFLEESCHNNVSGNNLLSNGITLEYSNDNIVSQNKVENKYHSGMYVLLSHRNTIYDNSIIGNDDGIWIRGGGNNIIENNYVTNNTNGIWLSSSVGNKIMGNVIINNTKGIYPGLSNGNIVYHNNFLLNAFQVYNYKSNNTWNNGYPSGGNYWSDYNGTDSYNGPHQNKPGSDGIADMPYVIDENNTDHYPLMQPYHGPVRNLNNGQTYPTIQEGINNASEGDTIFVLSGTHHENVVVNKTVLLIGESKDTTIIDGNLAGNVVLLAADNIIVMGFTIRRGGSWNSGIFIEFRSCNNTVADCIVSGNYYGIYLDTESCSNDIINNVVVSNYPFGIFAHRSYNNNVVNNTLSLNDDGIYLYQSWNNSIIENIIASNGAGILLGEWETSANFVVSNNVTYNDVGIMLHGGPQDNLIYHNNFFNNTNQASVGYPSRSNVWDDGYPSGGNYWSDHVRVDDYSGVYQDEPRSDGIVDEPYIIDDYNRDDYPLVEPWSPLPRTPGELKTKVDELWLEGRIDNQGIVKSLIAKLNVAQKLVDKGKINEAKSILEEDFIPQVQNLTDIHITPEAADILIKSAEYIISHL